MHSGLPLIHTYRYVWREAVRRELKVDVNTHVKSAACVMSVRRNGNQIGSGKNRLDLNRYLYVFYHGSTVTIKLECNDYGFECDFVPHGENNRDLIRELREHFEAVHDIDYTDNAVIQMVMNRGYSWDSINEK